MARTAVFLSPGTNLAAAVDCARRADGLGYDSVWVTHGLGRDALLVLSAYARVAPRVRLGTGVSHRPMMEGALGLDMGRPLEVMREYVAALRQGLEGRVQHAGARY